MIYETLLGQIFLSRTYITIYDVQMEHILCSWVILNSYTEVCQWRRRLTKSSFNLFWLVAGESFHYDSKVLHHCTMRLSIALKIWNIWKCKGLVFAQFWSNIHQVLTGRRLLKISVKNIGIWYLSNILEIWAKNLKGGSVKVEIFGGHIWDPCQKKPQNSFFGSRPLHCEIYIWII